MAYLKNETVAFTKTISDMYFVNKNHKQIAQMHIDHFMDYVRNKLLLDTREWNMQLSQKISEKSNSSIDEVTNLFQIIEDINNKETISALEVLKLEKQINTIKS